MTYKPTPTDLLGALAYEALKIVKATEGAAAGAAFPDPYAIAKCVSRMAEINNALIEMTRPTVPVETAEATLQ